MKGEDVNLTGNQCDMLKACELCGALVHQRHVDLHDEWHEKLRRAVDEAEMLG